MGKQGVLRVRICPKCKSREISLVVGGQFGQYECKNCGFRGSIFPEVEIKLKKKIRKKK